MQACRANRKYHERSISERISFFNKNCFLCTRPKTGPNVRYHNEIDRNQISFFIIRMTFIGVFRRFTLINCRRRRKTGKLLKKFPHERNYGSQKRISEQTTTKRERKKGPINCVHHTGNSLKTCSNKNYSTDTTKNFPPIELMSFPITVSFRFALSLRATFTEFPNLIGKESVT